MTKREAEVMTLMLKGYSNKDISEELFISVNTTKTHVAQILKKKNVKNRVELIAKHLHRKF